MEREQRELLAQQQETRRKMADLISAALTGKLQAAQTSASQPVTAPPGAPNLAGATGEVRGACTNPHINSNNAQGLFPILTSLFLTDLNIKTEWNHN